MDLALNNLQKLICYKTETSNQPTNQPTPYFCMGVKSAYSKPHWQGSVCCVGNVPDYTEIR